MTEADQKILEVATTLAKRHDTARRIATEALPGIDRLYWSQVAQDYAAMAGTLRAAVLINNPDLVGLAA